MSNQTDNVIALAEAFVADESADKWWRERAAELLRDISSARAQLFELEERRRALKSDFASTSARIDVMYAQLLAMLPKTPGPQIG